MKVLADTTHARIEKRSHNQNNYYVVFIKSRGYNKFYTLEKAFSFAREEIGRRRGA